MSAKVFDELTCPECGGQIGGDLAPGVKPCRCFEVKPAAKRRAFVADEPDPIDMAPLRPANAETAASPEAAAEILRVAAAGGKPCRICGKDLTGRTRMKDAQGYICKACSDAEFAAEAEADRDAIECPECKRHLKVGAFVEYRGTLICKRCKADHEDMDKLRVGKVALTKHDEQDKQRVATYAIIVGVLLLMGIVAAFLKH